MRLLVSKDLLTYNFLGILYQLANICGLLTVLSLGIPCLFPEPEGKLTRETRSARLARCDTEHRRDHTVPDRSHFLWIYLGLVLRPHNRGLGSHGSYLSHSYSSTVLLYLDHRKESDPASDSPPIKHNDSPLHRYRCHFGLYGDRHLLYTALFPIHAL